MGIADDLASVFDEIGTEFEHPTTLETERLDVSPTDKVGVYAITIQDGSIFSAGDLAREVNTGAYYLLFFTVKEQFENAPVVTNGRAFLCGNTATLKQSVTVKDPVTRKETITWNTVFSVPCFVSPTNTGNGLNAETDNVMFVTSNMRVVMKAPSAVKLLDRIFIDGSQFQVASVDTVRYPGLVYLELEEDSR